MFVGPVRASEENKMCFWIDASVLLAFSNYYYYFDSFNLGLAPLGESARFTTFFNVKE